MEEAYAQALWNIVEDGTAPAKAVELLHRSLTARGRVELMPRIARAFERLSARKAKAQGMTLTVAHERDLHAAHRHAAKALALLEKHTELTEVVDTSLIGGWRLEGGGVLIDESFKKQLMTLYNRATKD